MIAVHATDRPDGFMGYDINLFRNPDNLDTQDLVRRMDWRNLDRVRAPAPTYSLGGMATLGAGQTEYITVDLTPGRYTCVSEGYAAKGMVEEFRIK